MTKTDLLLMFMFVIAAGITWGMHMLLFRIIQPRRTPARFLFYLVFLLAFVFVIIAVFGITVIRLRDYLFS